MYSISFLIAYSSIFLEKKDGDILYFCYRQQTHEKNDTYILSF